MALNLFPKGREFFDLFERAANKALETAGCFQELVTNYTDVEKKVAHIKDLEHECDKITHETIERLNKTFITPLDREDIHALITSIDDIVDMIDATAIRLNIFKITRTTPHLHELARVLVAAVKQVQEAVAQLQNFHNPKEMLARCIEANRLENESDQIYRRALGELFQNEKDAIEIMKWKEIYDNVETAVDRCEDMANAIETVVLKNA
jgi:predicted phosphate transport protein (TIGR00153 family)